MSAFAPHTEAKRTLLAADRTLSVRPLAEVNAALEDLRAGKVVGRVVLVPTN
jgi:D-arabinose 1-dehydrogenase-like Zn-dependent alcohol dehydrogenase